MHTTYLAKAVEGHRLPPLFPFLTPDKQWYTHVSTRVSTTRTKHAKYTTKLPTTTVAALKEGEECWGGDMETVSSCVDTQVFEMISSLDHKTIIIIRIIALDSG